MAKIPTEPFIVTGRNSLSKKSVNYLICIEGMGVGKDIHYSAQNAALLVDLL